jgi:phosphotriesterase-related protein
MTVQTVLGGVSAGELGFTLMHEHVFTRFPDLRAEYRLGTDGWIDAAVAQLGAVRERGVRTIVDMTVLGIGRYVPDVRVVSERSGVNIVAATGLYAPSELPNYFRNRLGLGERDALFDFLVREIEEGIADTGIRAGVLKIATDAHGLTPGNEQIIRDVARAHRRTGVPISTHTHAASRAGDHQQRVLAEEGVDLGRVVIGHCGDSTDLDYLTGLMRRGSFIGMDRFGIETILSFGERVETVAELCRRGFAAQLVLSQDTNCATDNFPADLRQRPGWGSWRMTHLVDDVLPALRTAGVTDEAIHLMTVQNPRRILEPTASYLASTPAQVRRRRTSRRCAITWRNIAL